MEKNNVYTIDFQSQQRIQVQKEQLNKAIAAFNLQRLIHQVYLIFKLLESLTPWELSSSLIKWLCFFFFTDIRWSNVYHPLSSAMATRARATSHVENQVRESFKFYTIFRLVLTLGKRARSETINFWRARRPWRPNEWLPQCARLWATLTSTPGFTLKYE